MPRRSLFSSITAPTYSFGTMIDAFTYGSSTSSTSAGNSAGLCTSSHSVPFFSLHAIRDVRRGDEQVEVELALEPLAHDLHVQQAEEAAAEAEAERLRRLRLVEERRVVQLQLLERVAQLGVRVRVGREEPGEHHRLHVLVPGQRLARATRHRCQRVADAQAREILQPGDHVADLARGERLDRHHRRREEAELLRVEARSGRHRLQRLAARERAVDHADERDARRGTGRTPSRRRAPAAARRRSPVGARNALDDRVEDVGDVLAGLRGDADDLRGIVAEQVGHLDRGAVRVGLRQVDLVHDGDDLEPVLDREIGVRERLCLDPLRRIDDEQRALARLQRAGHLVGEVDVARACRSG